MDDSCGHESAIAGRSARPNESKQVCKHRQQHDRPSSKLEVRRNREQRPTAVHDVRVRDQARSLGRGDGELFRVDDDVHRRPQQRRVPQERVQRADDQDHVLLPFRPLEGVIGILGGDGEEGLPVCCIIALDSLEVDRAWDVALVRVARVLVSKKRRNWVFAAGCAHLCTRCGPCCPPLAMMPQRLSTRMNEGSKTETRAGRRRSDGRRDEVAERTRMGQQPTLLGAAGSSSGSMHIPVSCHAGIIVLGRLGPRGRGVKRLAKAARPWGRREGNACGDCRSATFGEREVRQMGPACPAGY